MRESPQSWRKPRSWLAVQTKPGPVAIAAPRGTPDCLALEPVPKGSWKYSSAVAAPTILTLFLWPAALCTSHKLQLPGGQQERALGVRGRPEPDPASPGCCITKAGSLFAALTPSVSSLSPRPCLRPGPTCFSSPCFSSGLSPGSVLLGVFLLWFLQP